jgi:predicted metal-binding protein
LQRYIELAKELGMTGAVVLKPEQVFMDPRAILKCRWGCEDFFKRGPKCSTRDTSFAERREMLDSYRNILMVHGHDAHKLSLAVLEIERRAFLDGNQFAFAVRYCKLCPKCALDQGKECVHPDKMRPCDQAFGIDVFRTARQAGLPIQVLQHKDDLQNRYGFVLLN